VEVVASLSQGRTAAAQCGLFTHKSVPVIFEPPCIIYNIYQNLICDFKESVPFTVTIFRKLTTDKLHYVAIYT